MIVNYIVVKNVNYMLVKIVNCIVKYVELSETRSMTIAKCRLNPERVEGWRLSETEWERERIRERKREREREGGRERKRHESNLF